MSDHPQPGSLGEPEPPIIRSVHVTTWNHDPWTRGPYSTLGVGGKPHHRSDLAAPIGDRLVFAGEHTSVEHPATMHGAYNSGVAAAAAMSERHQPATATVIGAGLSGLAAAQRLRRDGWEVVVLEATDRVGGRARTDRLPSGLTIHPGAAWIHGPIGNPIAAIADAVGTVGIEGWPHREAAFRLGPSGDAAAVDHTELASLQASAEAVLDTLRAHARVSQASGTPDEAMRGPLVAALDTIVDPTVRAGVKVIVDLYFESLMAGSLDDLSLQHGDEPYAYPGGDRYLTTVLQPVIDHLSAGLDIRQGSPVQTVDLGAAQVTVTLANGTEVTAAVCVVTVPLGVLQAGTIGFNPPLPRAHTDALARLRMGDKCKVFVEFDRHWWGDAQEMWFFPDGSTGPADGDHANVSARPTRWGSWVDTSRPCGAPVLCGFVGGSEGRRIQARFLNEPNALRAELATVFGPVTRLMQNQAARTAPPSEPPPRG